MSESSRAIAIATAIAISMAILGVCKAESVAMPAQDDAVLRRYETSNAVQPGALPDSLIRAILKSFATRAAISPSLPTCEQLATDPAYGFAGHPGTSRLSAIRELPGDAARKDLPATNLAERMDHLEPTTAPYCRVDFTYDSGLSGRRDGYDQGQSQPIGIRVGLPLRTDDCGTAPGWNGKIQNPGSGGCMGLPGAVTPATSHG